MAYSIPHVFPCQVLGAREPLPASTVAAYQTLAAALGEEEFEQAVLPSMLRMAKRSPESVLSSAAAFIRMLSIDLSPLATRLAAEMLPLIRHSKDTVR